MKLDHVAISVVDIEALRAFYEKYFGARSSPKYANERKRFTSYFLTFPGGGRVELMHRPDIQRIPDAPSAREFVGYAHLGVALGAQAAVDALTRRLQGDGFPVLDGPRRTGDGYYESMVADRGLSVEWDVGAAEYRERYFGVEARHMRGHEFYRVTLARVRPHAA